MRRGETTMLYSIFYFDAKTGVRHAEFDRDRRVDHDFKPFRGDVAQCVPGGDRYRDAFWVDDRGDVIRTPAWYEPAGAARA
jgi:hypothetical protein